MQATLRSKVVEGGPTLRAGHLRGAVRLRKPPRQRRFPEEIELVLLVVDAAAGTEERRRSA